MLLFRTLILHHELNDICYLVTLITSLLTKIIFLLTKIFIFVEIYLVEKCIRVQHIQFLFSQVIITDTLVCRKLTLKR